MENTESLATWTAQWLPAEVQAPAPLVLRALAGDAGFRQYYRVNSRPSLIAVYAPPATENNLAFVEKALAMRAAGVHVPNIHAVDFVQGFLLLEDLGDDLFLPLLQPQTVGDLYNRAEQELLLIQQVPPDASVFPLYDAALLEREMALFPEWFVEKLIGRALDEEAHSVLRHTFERLIVEARAQPQVVVHRDYHSRNLLALGDSDVGNGVGVVDFQDAVIGPVTYDLVSLLKDCYIRWPRTMVEQRAADFARRATARGIINDLDPQQFLRWLDLMGLQRHIKVLGIFARLWLRDGKARYLDDLPLVLRYTLEVADRYPEMAEFSAWFRARLLPLLPLQPWYRPELLDADATA